MSTKPLHSVTAEFNASLLQEPRWVEVVLDAICSFYEQYQGTFMAKVGSTVFEVEKSSNQPIVVNGQVLVSAEQVRTHMRDAILSRLRPAIAEQLSYREVLTDIAWLPLLQQNSDDDTLIRWTDSIYDILHRYCHIDIGGLSDEQRGRVCFLLLNFKYDLLLQKGPSLPKETQEKLSTIHSITTDLITRKCFGSTLLGHFEAIDGPHEED